MISFKISTFDLLTQCRRGERVVYSDTLENLGGLQLGGLQRVELELFDRTHLKIGNVLHLIEVNYGRKEEVEERLHA